MLSFGRVLALDGDTLGSFPNYLNTHRDAHTHPFIHTDIQGDGLMHTSGKKERRKDGKDERTK